MVAVSLWYSWLWVYVGGGCGFMALVDVDLCPWWLWICCGYEFGNGFVLVVIIGVVVAAVVVVDGRCCCSGGCAVFVVVVVVVEELIYNFNVL